MSIKVLTDLHLVASDSATQPPGPEGYLCLGYWDVHGGRGQGTAGTSGHYMTALYARFAEVGSLDGVECIQDVFLTACNDATPTPPSDDGYRPIGHWDVDDGGAVATNGSRGHYMTGLYVKTGKGGNRYIADVQVTASNDAFPAILGNNSPYTLLGYWDADDGGAVGTDGSTGHYMTGLFVRYATAAADLETRPAAPAGSPALSPASLLLALLAAAVLLIVAGKQHGQILVPAFFAIAGFAGGLLFRREAAKAAP